MQVTAKVFHNETPGDRFFMYNPKTSVLTFAHDVEVEDGATNTILEKVFRAANRVDGSAVEQIPDGVRSLSVGDVVVVKGQVFACDMIGWTKVEDGDLFDSVTRGSIRVQKGE